MSGPNAFLDHVFGFDIFLIKKEWNLKLVQKCLNIWSSKTCEYQMFLKEGTDKNFQKKYWARRDSNPRHRGS